MLVQSIRCRPDFLINKLRRSKSHFSTEKSPPSVGLSSAGLSGRRSRGGLLSVRRSGWGRPSPWPPCWCCWDPCWACCSGRRPILLMPEKHTQWTVKPNAFSFKKPRSTTNPKSNYFWIEFEHASISLSNNGDATVQHQVTGRELGLQSTHQNSFHGQHSCPSLHLSGTD